MTPASAPVNPYPKIASKPPIDKIIFRGPPPGAGLTRRRLHAALLVAGLRAEDELALYDGSWSEWGQEESGCPVATGAD